MPKKTLPLLDETIQARTSSQDVVAVNGMPFRIAGFELVEQIGDGGAAVVWRAEHVETRLPVAVKVGRYNFDEDDFIREGFEREARALARLAHPNIVYIFDFGTITGEEAELSGGRVAPGSPYIAMELASRGSLENIRRPIRWRDFKNIATQMLDGLGHAHARGVLHRDLKPANVLLGSTRDVRQRLKLADFGIAFSTRHHLWASSEDLRGEYEDDVFGTPLYMAPEQLQGKWRDYGPHTDLYSFGIMCWELLTGEPPFIANDAYAVGLKHCTEPLPEFEPIEECPSGVHRWLKRLLAKEPSNRYRFAQHAKRALDALGGVEHTPRLQATINPDLLSTQRVARPRIDASSLARIHTAAHTPEVLPLVGLSLVDLRVTPLIGRREDAESVLQHIRKAHDSGKGSATIIRGPSGVGVTHLAEHVTSALHESGVARIAHVSGDDRPGARKLLEGLAGSLLNARALPRDRMLARIVQVGSTWQMPEELIKSTLDTLNDPDSDARPVVAALLAHIGRVEPLVFWYDGSFVSDEMLNTLTEVIETCSDVGSQTHFVLSDTSGSNTRERHFIEDWAERYPLRSHRVRPLTSRQLDRLLDAHLPLDPTLRRFVAESSDGLPGKALAALRGWVRQARLVRGPTGWKLSSVNGDDPHEGLIVPDDA